MKRLFLFFSLLLASCFWESNLIGDCYPMDVSPYELSFDSQEGVDSTFVFGYQWWFTDLQKEKCKFTEPEKIECSWFSAEKMHDSFIIVSVKQNNTGKKRSEQVRIHGDSGGNGECSKNRGSFYVTQCPELIDIELSKEELLFGSEGGIDNVTVTTDRQLYIDLQYENIHYRYQDDFDVYISSHIKDPWFSVNVIDGKNIFFSVSKNETGKERNFSLLLDNHNCGTKIDVYQSAE
ncbi:MAG: hypothetical protein LBU89_02745 [Fibromonadaceae bacterium]|jgi:hypothetical protein|nr:hypothetical protein [Fibromonadaceae bacterium]